MKERTIHSSSRTMVAKNVRTPKKVAKDRKYKEMYDLYLRDSCGSTECAHRDENTQGALWDENGRKYLHALIGACRYSLPLSSYEHSNIVTIKSHREYLHTPTSHTLFSPLILYICIVFLSFYQTSPISFHRTCLLLLRAWPAGQASPAELKMTSGNGYPSPSPDQSAQQGTVRKLVRTVKYHSVGSLGDRVLNCSAFLKSSDSLTGISGLSQSCDRLSPLPSFYAHSLKQLWYTAFFFE